MPDAQISSRSTRPERSAAGPIIGVTADVAQDPPHKVAVSRAYLDAVREAGGVPIVLAPVVQLVDEYVSLCDGFVLTGGDDPIMEDFGVPTHPKAKPVHPDRQAFELALLDAIRRPQGLQKRQNVQTSKSGGESGLPNLDVLTFKRFDVRPALGICLGMQYMGLHAGGTLDQHLPDHLPTAADHWDKREHEVEGKSPKRPNVQTSKESGESAPCNLDVSTFGRFDVLTFGRFVVHSHHRQALSDAGSLRVIARAPDGVIEAIAADDHPFYLGVQWHPERTRDPRGGIDLFRRLVEACRKREMAK